MSAAVPCLTGVCYRVAAVADGEREPRAKRPPTPPPAQGQQQAAGAAAPRQGGSVRARVGCAKCVEGCHRARGVWVLMRRGERPCEGGVNPRANPFAIRDGQTRGAVVKAVRCMLQGEQWAQVAQRMGLLPHHSYLSAAGSGVDAALQQELARMAAMVCGGARLFLACGCACAEHGGGQEACHSDEWVQAVRGRAASMALEADLRPGLGPVQDSASGAVRTAKGKLLLDMFGGVQPVVAAAAARWGFTTVTLDTRLGPDSDLTQRAFAAQWVRECEAGNVQAFKSDLPCVSFTCLWGKPAAPGAKPKPKLRSRACLPDLPPTPPEWQLYMRKHEGFVHLTFDCATPTVVQGGRAVVEGPPDRGNPALPELYRKAYADHAPLELHPRARRFCEVTGGRTVYSFQCACGGAFQKATAHIADPATADALEPLCALPCVHEQGGHAEVADGVGADGQSLSDASRVYPTPYAEAVAVAVSGGSAADVSAVVMPAFREVVRATAAAGTLRRELPAWVLDLAVGAVAPGGGGQRPEAVASPTVVTFNPVVEVMRS